MSLRSVLLIALLLAVSAAARWTDVIHAAAFNVTPSKLCDPTSGRCVYVVKMYIDVPKVIVGLPNWWGVLVVHPNATYRHGSVATFTNIYMPEGLYYVTSNSFYVDGAQSARYVFCGKTYNVAAYVRAGIHNLTLHAYTLYYVDPRTCNEYIFAVSNNYIYNITSPWVMVYLFKLEPTIDVIWTSAVPGASTYTYDVALNGTEHQYRIMYYSAQFVGTGFYIGNYSLRPTIMLYYNLRFRRYGPVHFTALRNGTSEPMYSLKVFNIAQAPSDGIVLVNMPSQLINDASLAAIANDTAVYIDIVNRDAARGRDVYIYGRRYDLYDVTVADSLYVYNTRAVACPRYYGSGNPQTNALVRLDRAREIEICSDRTDTVYVAVWWDNYPYASYFLYTDVLPPGGCRRIRWDGSIPQSYLYLQFYNSSRSVCQYRYVRQVRVTGLTAFMRYDLLPNYTLVPVRAVEADVQYESAWRELLEQLKNQYVETTKKLLEPLQTHQNVTQAFVSFIGSQPRFTGTIRLDSATSAWLRTTLNELKKWQAAGASSSFGPVSTPQIPAAVAPAAAAAVAVAWAASRRDDDVAASAAVAGIAMALFGILMTLIYGPSSLTLVALGVVVAAAAAAWRRIS